MDGLPPAFYDHPYNGPVIEQVLPLEEVQQVCQGLRKTANPDLKACILFYPNFPGDKCYVIIPKIGIGGVSEGYHKILKRHEIGHCNGWPKNHPMG
ncbi:MAG TPA: hypothetical protein VHA13_05510 [Gammaproteobacteria bacterium]|nr:hypothetical protein [Gammaproteobacteria bacterium]